MYQIYIFITVPNLQKRSTDYFLSSETTVNYTAVLSKQILIKHQQSSELHKKLFIARFWFILSIKTS